MRSVCRRHEVPVLIAALAAAVPMIAFGQAVPVMPEQELIETGTAAAGQEQDGLLLAPEDYEPPRPPTADEVERRGATPAAAAEELERLAATSRSFAIDIREIIRVRYNEQRERISEQFEVEIGKFETDERDRRAEAIDRFHEFLQKYPDDPDYTPDAMFRLAELYFEKASDEYLQATQAYEDSLAAFESGERDAEPAPPAPAYDKTIELYKDLVGRFPAYRHADAARYLLGYSFGEEGREEDALAMYRALVENHPTSKFLPEVHTRIGEIYFDMNTREALDKSIAAYAKVLDFKDSPYYDKALYKLAWAHYRLDQFDQAVGRFVELVDFADALKAKTGRSGSELRAEALQYIAISMADEKWGGVPRAEQVFARLGDQPYIGEMWKRYGEILFDQTRYPQAIDVLRIARDRYPLSALNPEVQARIITSYERLRDFESATKEREVLVEKYAEGSAWHEANKHDGEALTRASELTERSLYTAAIYNHQQAQAYKSSGRAVEARASYRRAATGYQTYLDRFRDSKNAYDFNFYLGECLYYSEAFVEAAAQYEKVRDSNADNRHLEAAALSAVIAFEKEIERQEGAGALAKMELKTAAERGEKPIEPREIPAMRKELIAATDRFVTLLPKSERVPAVAYRAGEIFYNHEQFEEARTRFEWIVVNFPGTEVARYSANLIIESYLTTKDWDNVQMWSQRLVEISEKAKPADLEEAKAQQKLVSDLKKFKVGAVFKKAEELDAKGDHEAAANLYVQIVDDSPESEFADKALFNAAIGYEKVKRYDAASKVYQRIYDDYPSSSLADRALFRVGVNYEKGFDFAGAISAYTKLVERYGDSPHRADALYNVAVTLENMQQYGQAAAAFKRYATSFPDREDSGDIFFRAAIVSEKMQAWPEMISTLEEFIKRYKTQRKYGERVVEAYKKIGDAWLKSSRNKSGVDAYRACVQEYDRRGYQPKDRAASFAAQCQFELAEDLFRDYDKIQLVGTGKKQVQSLQQKAQMQRSVEGGYKQVYQYKRVETTLAALYRVGYSYERFAESLFAAEVPPEFQSSEELAGEYKLQLEQKAAIIERKAESAYRTAFDEGRKTKVTNEWTQRTLEGLNKYKPEEFPVQKPGKPAMQTFTITGHGLDTLDGEPRKASSKDPERAAQVEADR